MIRPVEILERAFRHAVVYPLLRIVFRNKVSNEPLDLGKIRRILIFRFDRIGDMIVTTPVFRILKRRNQGLHIGVIASPANEELVSNSPYVDEVYVLRDNWRKLISQILKIRVEKYDVVMNFVFNRTTSPGILANLIAPNGFKVGQGPDKYSFYFNRLLKLPRFERHMADTLVFFVEQVFGISVPDEERGLEIAVSRDIRERVDGFLKTQRLHRRSLTDGQSAPYAIVNLSVKHAEKKLSLEQVSQLAKHLMGKGSFRVVLVISPGDAEMKAAARNLPELSRCSVYETVGDQPLAQLASLVEGALFVITMDTALVHFASAMNTPVLAFYTELLPQKEWSPYRVPHGILISPAREPISGIPIESLLRKTDEFMMTNLPGGLSEVSRTL